MEGVKLSEQTRERSCSLQREGIGCGTIACLCSPIFATDAFLLSWQVYDVSNFVSAHPGGIDQIMLGAGHDITPLFHCYHQPKTIKYYSMMEENINFGFIILGFLRNTMLAI